jgi:hypothetical protein
MDGLSAAASVFAVVQIAKEIIPICCKYIKGVKNAPAEIERLREEVVRLLAVLEGAEKLLASPDGAKLETSQRLRNGLKGSYEQLVELKEKLDTPPDKVTTMICCNLIPRTILRLKWPFESKEIEDVIHTLSKFRETISDGLIIDQT